MIKYEYQVLRYFHDLVTEEFVNVGIVLYAVEMKFLEVNVISKPTRISNFFSQVDSKHLMKSIRHFEKGITKYNYMLNNELFSNKYHSILGITSEILPKDDSSLQLSKVYKGISLDLKETFDYLFNRYIKEDTKKEADLHDDETGLIDNLHSELVKSKLTCIEKKP